MVTMIPRSKLEPHPDNPRKDLGDLTELAASIKRSGLLQNLTVVPSPAFPDKYRVIIGHRRLAASEIAGLDELPCVIQNMDMPTQIATMIAENMQRNDLSLTDQVGGVQMMMDLKTAAYKFVTFVLLHGGYMRPAELPRWRKLCGSEGKDGKHLTEEDWTVINANPLKAMVQAAYQKWDSSGNGENQRCTNWLGEYEKNEDLLALYNHLAALGYQIADEEWDWLLGRHECYRLPDGTTITKEDDEE